MQTRWVQRASMIGLMLLLTCSCRTPVAESTRDVTEATRPPLSGRVTFAGSTTVQPLAAVIGKAFNQQHPDVALEIAAGGSSVGIKAIHDGTVDIGMASRNLAPDERQSIEVHQVAVDVIAIVVNSANPVDDLALAQLQGIYMGEITNWAEVGGVDGAIQVAIRETTSGTRKAFDELVLDDAAPMAPNQERLITAGDVAALVASTENAIGYVGFGNLEEGLKLVSIDGVAPTEANVLSGTYSLMRPLLLLTGPLSQPQAMAFINFALSEEGQNVVTSNGWIPAR